MSIFFYYLYKKIKASRGELESQSAVQEMVEDIIAEVNKKLQPYARITNVIILDEPLEMTTTKKVKRIYNK